MKTWISTLLAIDFAIGFCTIGSNDTFKKAEKAAEPARTAITEIAEQFTPCKQEISLNRHSSKKIGTFSLTFYVADAKWGYSTSTGARSTHLQTCAVDPKVIPYGSVIQITGNNGQTLTLKAVDCGGGIVGNKIDIFWDRSIKEGYDWIAQFGTIHDVYLLEE